MVRDDGGHASQTVDVINYIMPFLKSSSENLQYTIKYIDPSVPLVKQLAGNVFYEHNPLSKFQYYNEEYLYTHRFKRCSKVSDNNEEIRIQHFLTTL